MLLSLSGRLSIAKRFSFPGQLPVQTDISSHLSASGLVLQKTSSGQVCKHRSHKELPLEPKPEGDEHKHKGYVWDRDMPAENVAIHLLIKSCPDPFSLLGTSVVDADFMTSGSIMSTWRGERIGEHRSRITRGRLEHKQTIDICVKWNNPIFLFHVRVM